MTQIARFIGGTGRSGTAVLGLTAATHPDVTYFREPRFLSDGGGLCDYVLGDATLDEFKDRMVRKWRKNLVKKLSTTEDPEWVRSTYTREAVADVVEETLRGEGRIVGGRKFVERLFGMAPAAYWVEKTPHTVERVDVLYLMFPKTRYVHMIRDPKDVFASLKHQHWGPKRLWDFVRWYLKIMGRAKRAAELVPAECYMTVEMEALIAHPCSTVGRVMRFFEIPYTPGWLFDAGKRIDPRKAHVGRADVELSPVERRTIERECGPIYVYWRAKANG